MEFPCVPSYIEDMPPVSRPTRGTDIVICEPIRTPVGAFGGVFANTTVTDLAATVLSELVTRTGLSEGDVDDVIRSEEHTSELQSLMRISYAVFCLKKKKTINRYT